MRQTQLPTTSKLTLATLLVQGRLSQHKIAAKTGVSRSTVARVAKEIKDELAGKPELKSEYQNILEACLPPAERAKRYETLAKQDKYPAVALQTVIRVEDLLGIITEKDRLRAINLGEGQQRQGPMFMMAPGSTVQVLNQRVPHDKLVTQEHQVIEDKTVI